MWGSNVLPADASNCNTVEAVRDIGIEQEQDRIIQAIMNSSIATFQNQVCSFKRKKKKER